jgi:carboxyl-terminal processing protease
MIRRILLLLAVVLVLPASEALAARRVALVIGNSTYQNVARLENPRNDAVLMANTLKNLGFTLTGGGAQLDLDKSALDAAVQKFGADLQGADVGMFYYAGHGVQVRGSNYLVPVGANPTRETDVDFQMVDVNLVLRQMEAAGTKLNLVVLDACRNNPFGGRGLRATDGGLAQMRAPEGTLISFATQPGNVAMDGQGDSPFTAALATTITKPGLDIFQTFNEVGLAVKRSSGGSQQPWVSSSPIDGNFYFVTPLTPASTPSAAPDEAAQAWAATRETTSLAVMDAFIQQYGNSIYGPFARARREELKNNQKAGELALAGPKPSVPVIQPASPRLSRGDVAKLFEPFSTTITQIEKNYVDERNDRDLYAATNTALRQAYPPTGTEASLGSGNSDLNSVYDTALAILNRKPTNSDDNHIVEVAITGVLASLDPHSTYMSPADYLDMQSQTHGSFGGLGIEVSMENGLIKVVTPYDGSPAAKAGIRANDMITAVDDVSIQGFTLSQAVGRMRGPVGSQVKLKLTRPGVDNPLEMILVRDTIRVASVTSRVEGDVGYIKIATFNEQTDSAFKRAVTDLSRQVANDNLKGYIIDLRNSPGGLLDSVVSVSDDLLPRGEIVSTRGRGSDDNQRFSAKPGDVTKGKRLVILINGGTASGSEIVAGALQDNKRATLIGTRTYGKGSIQTIFPLGTDRGALRLTTSRYYTPLGNSIQAKGILPDIEVVQAEPDDLKKTEPAGEATLTQHLPGQGVEQVASQSYVPKDVKDDKALAAALDLLHAAQAQTRNNH